MVFGFFCVSKKSILYDVNGVCGRGIKHDLDKWSFFAFGTEVTDEKLFYTAL